MVVKNEKKINKIVSNEEGKSIKVDLKSNDGHNFGKISLNAMGAIRGGYLDKYSPLDDEEKNILDTYRKHLNGETNVKTDYNMSDDPAVNPDKNTQTKQSQTTQKTDLEDRLHNLTNKPAATTPQVEPLSKATVVSDYVPSATSLTKEEYNRRRVSNPDMPEFGSYEYFKNREEALANELEKSYNDNYYTLADDNNIKLATEYKNNSKWTDDSTLLEKSKTLYNTVTQHNRLLNEYKSINEQLEKFEKSGVHRTASGDVDTKSGISEAEYAKKRLDTIAKSTIMTDADLVLGYIGTLDEERQEAFDQKGKTIGQSNVEAEKAKAYDYYEKNKDNVYKNNPWGVITGNYEVGKIGVKSSDAGYISYDATSADIEASEIYELLSERIQKKNATTFNNDNAIKVIAAPILQYLPQAKEQAFHRTVGQVLGAGISLGAGADPITGAKIGGSVAAANYMFKQTAGATYVRLLKESDLSVEDAKILATNEALASSAVEFGLDIALSELWFGGKAIKNASGKIAANAGDNLLSALMSKGISEKGAKLILNIAKTAGKTTVHAIGEGTEEFIQEGMSITADRYAESGYVPSAFELALKSFDFSEYSKEDFSRMGQSFLSGMIIGFASGGFEAIKSAGANGEKNAYQNYRDKQTIKRMTVAVDAKTLGDEVIKSGNKELLSETVTIAKESNSREVSETARRVEKSINQGEVPNAEDVGTLVKNAVFDATNDTSSSQNSTEGEVSVSNASKQTSENENAAVGEKTAAESEPIFTDELDELQNTEMSTVSVGDEFTQADTGNIVRIVSRGDTHTTIEIVSKNGTETRKVHNKTADGYLFSDKFKKVERTVENNENSPNTRLMPHVAQTYNVIVSNLKNTATELGLMDSNTFERLSNVNLFSPTLNDVELINNEFHRIFEGTQDNKIKGWLSWIDHALVEAKSTQEERPTQLIEDFEGAVDDIVSVSDEVAKEYAEKRIAVEVAKKTPSVILENVEGAKDLKIIINYTKLYLAVRKSGVIKGHYHNLGTEIAKRLPQFLTYPDAIVQLANGRLNVFSTVETEKGNNGIISVELNSTKDIGGKYEDYNVIVTLFSSDDSYVKNLLSGDGVTVKYKREDISQVNPQLYTWLAIVNDKSSQDNIVSQDNNVVKDSIRRDDESDASNNSPNNTVASATNSVANESNVEYNEDTTQTGNNDASESGSEREEKRYDSPITEVKLTDKCELIETKHTQTGAKLWVVSIKERLSKDEYSRLLDIVKKHGGYFSSAAKSLDGKKLSGFIFKEQPIDNAISAINDFFGENESVDLPEVEPDTVKPVEPETITTKEGNDDVHDGLLDRPSADDDAGRESESVPKTEEERNSGYENREPRKDVTRSGGALLQATEEDTSASGQLDGRDNDDRVREPNDSEGHGAAGIANDDNVDVAESGSKNKDFVITKAIAEDIDTTAPSMNDNIKAIETLHTIESSGKSPTKAQQGLLAKFKGWGGLAGSFYGANRSKLSELMSEDELKAAQGTVNDAYFTPTSIIDSIYKALNHLGFEGGNILEPSMGVGNFFGRMPKSVKDSSFLFGVEIDSISGRIARQLYPTANIEIAPFQDVAYKDGAFDLIVGNVPFGEVKYKYKGKKYLIHDYFFVKAMDKLSDGGILAFLTTKGTLDKLDSVARTELGKKGKLIAAYRLPSDVFSRSAGANVVTDLIIMQKTADNGGESFINLGSVSVGANEFSVNEYFVNHPENIIGELVSKRDWRSGKEVLDVKSTGNVAEQLLKAIKKLPRNMLSGAQTVGMVDVTEKRTAIQTFAVTDSGDVEYVDAATGEVKQLKGKQAVVAKEYIKLKNVYEDLINATLSENETSVVEGKRKDLNTAYDGFVKKNGTLEKNKKVLSADNDFYKISGLEVYDTKAKKFIKSEMFTKDTLGKRIPKKADNALDALSISIGESGGVNLNRIAELTGLSESEVIKQLDGRIVYTPEGIYELSEVYLSGNVREKYETVKGKKGFEKNEEMLKAVIPDDIPAKNITPQFGAPWIKSDYVADFLKETLHLYHKPTVNYDPTTGTWSISGSTWGDNTLLTSKYGTKYIDAISLAEKALNMRQIVIRDKDKRVLVGETRAAQQKAEDIKSAFEEWCFKDSDRRKDLVATFNEKFNSNRNMDFSELAKYLTFDGLTDTFKLRHYQKRAVARAIFNSNTLLAHGVGTGKTAEMIAVAMELKRMGMAKKNMMVVPGHKVADFRNDILKMYPSAKVAMLEKGANATQRQKFYALVAANDFDIVIIPHSSFGMLDVSLDTKKAFINNQIAELEEVLTAAQAEKGKIDGRFIRQLENQKDRLEEKLKFVTETAKDSGNIFEELGVDSLFVDEAHNFKNLPFYSKLSRVAGVSINQPNNKTRASRAENMFMITDYLNRSGGRITFGTATPITNSMSEIYNMMRFLRPDILADAGLQSFDAWASMFGSIVNQAEVDPSGRNMRMKERFSKFKNVSQMIEQFRRMADILKTGDVIEELPKAERIDVINESNDIQEEFLDIIDKMIDDIRTNGQRADHNMLEVTTAGQMAAVDLRFVASYFDGKYSEDDLNLPGNRTTQVAQRVYDEYVKSTASKGTQFVFCDVGVSDDASKKYNFYVYGDLINKLVAHGIPRNEIAIAQEFEDKADLSAKVNTGEIRILIGSTAVMGEGMNAQNKAVALHHMTVPARPSDIEQREGRIIRYGNENKNVRIYRYIQEKSYDSYQWQMQERKASFINQALSGGTVEELEEMSDFQLSAREAKAIASGNPLLLEKIEIEDKLSNLKSIRNKFNTDKLEMQDRLAMLPSQIAQRERIIADSSADAKTVAANTPVDFEITIGKAKYTERTKAADALKKFLADAPRNGTRIKIGSYSGLDLYYTSSFDKGTHYILKGSGEYSVLAGESVSGNITRIANLAEKVGVTLETDKARVANYKAEIETLKNEVNAEFPKAKELEELQAKLNDIDTQLGINVSTVDMSEVIVDDGIDDGESANYSLESEDIDNERNERNALSDGSGGRDLGSRSGKQIAGLDKATETSENRSLKASERKAYTEKLTANQLEQRTERDSKGRMHRFFAIKRSSWNDNMRNVADYYEQRGINVQFLKGNIQCAFVGNEYEARAMQKGDTLYIRYDHEYYSPEQLAEHEYIEANFESEDVQKAKKQILDKMSDTEYNKAIERLKEQYKGVTDDVTDLERELVCNVLSGMYENSAAYSDIATAFWAKDESISQGYNAANYSDMSDAGGNADVVDAIGYGSENVVEEGAQSDGGSDTERVGADGTRKNNDSVWQRSEDSEKVYTQLGSKTTLRRESQSGGYRYIDWSREFDSEGLYHGSFKRRVESILRTVSQLEIADTDQYGRALTKSQKKYFAQTVAKNSSGELIPLYHATDSEFDAFMFGDFGYHIGDLHQAMDIGGKYIKEVFVNITNPFFIEYDIGIWTGDIIANALLEQNVINAEERKYFASLDGFWENDSNSEANLAIKSFMKQKGFDGIVYLNDHETRGLSFIAFDSNQIKYTSNRNPTVSDSIRYSLDTYDKDAASLSPERKKEIFEQFNRDKAGPKKASVRQVFGERAAWVAHNMTRVFPDIPERGEKGTFFAEFRKMMVQWKGLANTSSFMVQDKLNKMTEGLTSKEFDVFSKLVYYLDLQEEAQIQADKGYTEILLPNEIKPEEVDIIVIELTAEASDKVKQALAKRQSIWNELKEKYIALNQYIGFETEGKFKRKNYYHHQVIDYMNKEAKGIGNRDVEIKSGRGWLKERQGSTKAINTDFLAVEYKALLQMQYDVYVASILGKIKKQYDIKPQLEKAAFDNNKAWINGIIATECVNEDGTMRLDGKGKPDSDTYRQQMWFNQRIMYGFSGLFELADRGVLPAFDGQYAGVVDALKYENLRVAGLYKYIGELASVELLNDASEDLTQAVISARTVLKYTSQKKAWIKSVLGDKYQTWETLAKEMSDTHTIHQPRRGNYFYTKTTIDEDSFNRAFGEMISTLANGAKGIDSTDDVKQIFLQYSETVRLMGAAYEQWVLPNEIVKTMDSVANPKQASEGAKAARAIVSAWKGWSTSVNPLRTVKFGLRNVFGDIDAVIAGNPRVVKYSKRAVGEIYQAMRHKNYSPEFMEWVERGGYSSMIFANEMDSEMQDKLFAHLKEKESVNVFKAVAKAFEGYYDGVKLAHDFREAILRYSSYLYFKEVINKNGGVVKDNVASNRFIVQGLTSVEDKAYQLSKDLLGAYDEVGMMGQTLRRYWVPFYSFTETNLKRYYRMFENVIMSDASIPEKVGKTLLKGLMVNLIALLMLAWNKLVMKEEDEKLPPSVRNIPHITLGQIGDDVIAFRQLGSFSEILEWFGLEDYKWTSEDLTAPIDKAWGMITPFVKMPVELASGLNFYPSLTEPRAIRDKAQHLFNSLGVDDIYDIVTGKPTKGIGEVIKGAFVYSYDYQESAYYEILDIKRNYQGKNDNAIYGADKKSNALYYMKRAIKFKDKKVALKYLNEYFENGGTGKGIKQSFATLNPMYGYTGKETIAKGEEFIASLSVDEKEKLKIAQIYYENELMLPENVSSLLGKKNITNEQAKNLLTNYINSQCK